jgi:CubicO group peptidase (beta-lactamase class C family)
MKRTLSAILILLLLVLPILASAATTAEIDDQVDSYFTRSRTTGGALVVFQDGEIVYQRYYGYQDKTVYAPVTENTYFRVASVTKLVSAIGLMQLKDQGLVDLDEDISAYFGYKIANFYYPDTSLTLRQLMSHTSTVSESGGYSSGNTVYDMLSEAVRHRANYTDDEPGSVYQYSNFGAGLVGAIMEAVSGVSVDHYMVENVFAPLGIDAAYDPVVLKNPEDMADLYQSDGTRYRSAWGLLRDGYEDFADPETHYGTTVGKLWIRAKDLAKLGIALCGDGSVDGVQLLTPESVQEMREDQAALGKSVTGDSPYGLLLQRVDSLIDGHTFYGYQGTVAGVLCNLYFEPETQFGFVMLTNGCNNGLDSYIGVLARRQFVYAYETFVGTGQPEK